MLSSFALVLGLWAPPLGGEAGFAAHLQALEAAATARPGDPAPALRLAQGLGAHGDAPAARRWLAEARRRGAHALRAALVEGDVRAAAGDPAGALNAYFEVVQAAPRNGYAHVRLWTVLRTAGALPATLDVDRVRRLLGERGYTLPRDPSDPAEPGQARAARARGDAALRAGRFREALRHFEQGLRFDPTDAATWRGLAITRSRLRQTDEAIAAYRLFVHLSPRRTHDTRRARQIILDHERRRARDET
ncbi:MAG: tetratricopeptide repeat protein [Myxococcales bacterium]|nr:tetratricopeptide repeat protein [Myxococcales bacterium]